MDTPKKPKRRKRPDDPIGFLTGKCALDGTPAEQESALKGLASVVVDELMLLRKMGLKPAQIRAMYSANAPAKASDLTRTRPSDPQV